MRRQTQSSSEHSGRQLDAGQRGFFFFLLCTFCSPQNCRWQAYSSLCQLDLLSQWKAQLMLNNGIAQKWSVDKYSNTSRMECTKNKTTQVCALIIHLCITQYCNYNLLTNFAIIFCPSVWLLIADWSTITTQQRKLKVRKVQENRVNEKESDE